MILDQEQHAKIVVDNLRKAQLEYDNLCVDIIEVAKQYFPLALQLHTLGYKFPWGNSNERFIKAFDDRDDEFAVEEIDLIGNTKVVASIYVGGGEYEHVSLTFPTNYLWDGLSTAKDAVAQLEKSREAALAEKTLQDKLRQAQLAKDKEAEERRVYEMLKEKFEKKP